MQVDYETPGAIPPPASVGVRALLSAMMFLQFFVWGSWYVTCGNYMAAHGMTTVIYLAYMVGPLAAIVSPFFLGIVADRFFASERVLGVLMLIAAASMVGAAIAGARGQPSLFIGMLLLHMLAYMPTLGLTNTIALSKLSNPEKQFPIIRVFGTFGWIVANWATNDTVRQFYLTGGAAIVLALLSVVLPHTPAPARGQPVNARTILGLDSLKLMKSPSFAIFILSSFLICVPLAAYYAYAPIYAKTMQFQLPRFVESLVSVFSKNATLDPTTVVMSLGQISEVFFMIVMPLCFAALGVRYMLAVGMLAWVVRYALFAVAAPDSIHWMVIIGIMLHGVCYDFFFVTGFIYVDRKAPTLMRGQAQGFLVLITQGLGMLVGGQLSGLLFNRIVSDPGTQLMANWQKFWIAPCIAAAIVLLIFFLLFRDDTAKSESGEVVLSAGATT